MFPLPYPPTYYICFNSEESPNITGDENVSKSKLILKIEAVDYRSQDNHIGQQYFYNLLAEDCMMR